MQTQMPSASGTTERSPVVKAPVTGGMKLPAYTISSADLGMGASYGNAALWVNTKNTGAIERVFSNEIGETVVGAINCLYAMAGNPIGVRLESTRDGAAQRTYASLRPEEGRRTFQIHPAFQRVAYTLASKIAVEETTFLPLDDAGDEAPILYHTIAIRNDDDAACELRFVGYARLRGMLANDICAEYDPAAQALVAWNASRPDVVRVLGLTVAPTRYATTLDYSRAYDTTHVHQLPNDTQAHGDILGGLQLDLTIAPHETKRFALKLAISVHGREAGLNLFRSAAQPSLALEATIAHLQESLSGACVLTPDPVVNEGALWSKVNMRRVMARYPHGQGFTNDPGNTAAVVIRDSCWFAYGNDHFRPEFSRAMLERIIEVQYASGKMPEFFNPVTGDIEDDGLNINDDTPLFILAVNHHYRSCGDVAWLKKVYPAVAKAANYILAQRDARGLVFCSAKDARGNVWAIASWRNIIPNYTINGAVTEINAECVAALRSAGHLCENTGAPQEEAGVFFEAARDLRAAMDRYLVNPENGLYYLNIDADGNIHTDVTADQIFPVIFRACDEETGFRIISRLNAPDFWTSAGLRTASCYDPLYDPSAASGLIGGVWPGLTWWYAFAAASYHPDFMVRGLRVAFDHYASAPRKNNTVPGQFSEWFDGEALVNKGMRLSPWEPPRFLWAAVEGVCGLMLTPGLPRINPLIPQTWKWVALQRLRYHGAELTYFAVKFNAKFHIFATGDIDTDHDKHLYGSDVSSHIEVFSESAVAIALRKDDDLVILVGNVGATTACVPLGIERVLEPEAKYRVREYNSEREAWEKPRILPAASLRTLALTIETMGYRLLEITRHY